MNFKLFLLRLLSRNLDDILAVFNKLDAQLDAYIVKEAQKQAQIRDQINALAQQLQASEQDTHRASNAQARVRDLAGRP